MIEALDADKQEAIARKYRNAAMRLRVQALAKQQVGAHSGTHALDQLCGQRPARRYSANSTRLRGFLCPVRRLPEQLLLS